MWVQLKVKKQFQVAGSTVRYQPGDWVDIGNSNMVRRMLANGEAVVPRYAGKGLLPRGSGLVMHGMRVDATAIVKKFAAELPVEYRSEIELAFDRTIIWYPALPLRTELIPAGLFILDTWHIALPLNDYKVLAANVGEPEEQDRTRAVIRDLRVMTYDTRLMFVRRCKETIALFDEWAVQHQVGDNKALSFLRALYIVKPLVLALPLTWATPSGRDPYDAQ